MRSKCGACWREQRWEDAVALWGGDLAPGFHVSEASEFEHWLDDQRNSLRRAIVGAAWRRVDELERSGDAGLVPAAQRAWKLEPANEAGARRLMRFLDVSVGRAAALRAYDELVDYLRRESEGEPSAETRALASEIKARIEPELSPTSRARPVAAQPSGPDARAAGAAPSDYPTHHRRRSALMPGIVGALLMVGVVSVFALHPSRAPSPVASEDPMQAGRDSALRLPARYRQDTSAYASYLRGLALRFTASQSVSRDTFAALVEREPLYAPGLSGLAHAYALTTIFGGMPPTEGWPKVEAAAKKAIALDSASASAYLALGSMEMFWHWNLPRARELIDRGLALEPADPEAHAMLGTWFRWRAEMDSGVAEARKSTELDPLNPYWARRLARQLYLARRYAEAEAMYRQLLWDIRGMDSPMANCRTSTGPWVDHTMRWKYFGPPPKRRVIPLRLHKSRSRPVMRKRTASFVSGPVQRVRDLDTRRRAGESIDPDVFAFAYAALQDRDATLHWFDSMLAVRSTRLPAIGVDPLFDFLRDDPRYKAWEAKLPWKK